MRRVEILSRFFLAFAATVLMFFSGVALPAAGLVLVPFVPQPALTFGLKYGIGWGLGVLGLAMVILNILAGEEVAVIYGTFALMTGLLFGMLGRVRAIESIVFGVAAAASAYSGGLMFYFFGSWSATMSQFRESLTHQFSSALSVREKMGFSQDGSDLIKERLPQIIDMMLQILPAIVFLSLAFVILINLVFLCRRFPERREQWLRVENLREWKGPESTVWALIACGFALFIPGLEFVQVIAVNVLLIVAACYFAQGLAVVAYFFHKNNVPRFLRGLTYLLIVFQQIFTLLVTGLGLFDLWGDFRRLDKKHLTPSQAA